MSKPIECLIFDEKQSYEAVYQWQKDLVEQRIKDQVRDTLLLGEHPHVITMGRGTHPENILNPKQIPVIEIERGGDVTYHGPGQLVGYPIFQLETGERDLHRYLRMLEEVLMDVLAHYGIVGRREPGWTGVWVGEKKIASIGVAVRKWVTYHGFALNVTTNLSYFNTIHPCGLSANVMTSLEACLSEKQQTLPTDWLSDIQPILLSAFGHRFHRCLENG